jgi:hypothetical protein
MWIGSPEEMRTKLNEKMYKRTEKFHLLKIVIFTATKEELNDST